MATLKEAQDNLRKTSAALLELHLSADGSREHNEKQKLATDEWLSAQNELREVQAKEPKPRPGGFFWVDVEREGISSNVSVPTLCPKCGADLTNERALKVWSKCEVMQYGTLGKMENEGAFFIEEYDGDEMGEIGDTVGVYCGQCEEQLA